MPADEPSFLRDGGVTGELIRSIDWALTPLGRVASWPQSLATALGILLHSPHPMFLWWGPELIQFYNDAYLPSFGEGKHPAAMGQRGQECWQEIWPIIGPQIQGVLEDARATWHEDALVPIYRNGRLEDVYWTYGYSPVFGDAGEVAGVLVVCTETTARVLASRRDAYLRVLTERLAACLEPAAVIDALTDTSSAATQDLAFVMTYGLDPAGDWRLVGVGGLSRAERGEFDLAARAQLARLPPQRQKPLHADPLALEVVGSNGPHSALAALATLQQPGLAVVLFGLNPRLPFDAEYLAFLAEVIDHLNVAWARLESARVRRVLEDERRNLLQQAPVAAAVLVGPAHVFELANAKYVEIVGGRQLLGKSYEEAFPELVGGELPMILDRVYRTGESFSTDEYLVPLLRDDSGELRDCYFRFQLEPLRKADGSIYGMMAVAVDITPQVVSRRVLERSNVEHEKLLVQLEAASLAKDEFLATVSHELRTPLTSILGWSRLLRDTSEPARLRKGLAVIERNAQAQSQLIEDILDVSRIISGKFRMNTRTVDPAAVVGAAVETVRPLANAKQLSVSVEIARDMSQLAGDEDRLQQVVWNLLSNSVKFTPAGGAVAIRAHQVESTIVIAVEDNGRGISPEFLPHVFDRFRQDDTSSTRHQAGLGLGLAIVRHLVELHGGTVAVHSAGIGRGARFEVSLPVRAVLPKSDSVPPGSARADVGSDPPRASLLRGRRVLVIDDQPDARDLLATVLEDAGASVSQAASVAVALQTLARSHFDAVVCDIGMPDADGYDFMRELRLREAQTGSLPLPVVALTAFARSEDRLRALKAGFQLHVAKPIDPEELIRVVERLVSREP